MPEGNAVLRANEDGIFIENSETRRLDKEIGRLKFLLAQWEYFETKEKLQEEIYKLEGMKQDQSYLTS